MALECDDLTPGPAGPAGQAESFISLILTCHLQNSCLQSIQMKENLLNLHDMNCHFSQRRDATEANIVSCFAIKLYKETRTTHPLLHKYQR